MANTTFSALRKRFGPAAFCIAKKSLFRRRFLRGKLTFSKVTLSCYQNIPQKPPCDIHSLTNCSLTFHTVNYFPRTLKSMATDCKPYLLRTVVRRGQSGKPLTHPGRRYIFVAFFFRSADSNIAGVRGSNSFLNNASLSSCTSCKERKERGEQKVGGWSWGEKKSRHII